MINQLKTVFFLGLLTGLFLAAGYGLGGISGMTIALVLAGVMNFITFFFSDKLVLRMYKAKETTKASHKELHELIEGICNSNNLPKPKIYIIPTNNPNAFATGRNPKNAAVAVTQGIMQLLSKNELKGVLAHEMAHIKNRDILISTIAAMVAGAISYLATMAQWAAIFGGFGRDDDGGNIIGMLALAIVTPIIATLIHMAISRAREFEADKTGAKMIQDPYSLAHALEKLHAGSKRNPIRFGSESTAHMFITNPFKARGLTKLFSTHPPMEERVKRLKAMH